MNTITAGARLQPSFVSSNTARRSIQLPWLMAATTCITGLAFFAAGHDFLISKAVAYTQSAEEMQVAALGGNLVRRLAFFVLGGWGFVLLTIGKQKLKLDWTLTSAIGALLVLALASVGWTNEPGMCIRRLFVLLFCVIAAAGCARAFSLRDLGWLVIVVIGSLVAIGIATEVVFGTFRPWSSEYRFAGTVHPNTQGPALAALCLAALALASDAGRYRPFLWFVFAASVVLLLLTKSRTAAAALVASVMAVQIVKLPLRTQLVGIVSVAFIVAAGLWSISICGLDPIAAFRELLLLGRSSESDSLSGRTLIWPEVMRHIHERFWLGYGYESFWTPAHIEAISEDLGWGLREAHNGYLEIWLWLGIVGVVLMLFAAAAAILAASRRFRTTNDAAYLLPLGLLVFGLCDSCLESGVVVISLVPFLLGCCVLRLALFGESAFERIAKDE